MHIKQRQATLKGHACRVQASVNLQRCTPPSANRSLVSSASIARPSKWPKHVYFASDFIAAKAASAASASNRSRTSRRNAGASTTGDSIPRRKAGHETATRTKNRTTGARSQTDVRAAYQGGQGHCNNGRPAPRGDEGARSLEEAASALLLLHSRYFGGIVREEDIVSRLCILCREAGWMGNPLRACPGLDPLVVQDMVVGRLGETPHHLHHSRGKRFDNIGDSTNNGLSCSPKELSLQAFYRILADVARLVYPEERRAMQMLLIEGVLPLVVNNDRRIWPQRPELLYGRPALAALRIQRDTLRELYFIYESRIRSTSSLTGISRKLFLKMLADLGVTPGSVSEEYAASVFDGVVRNGLPDNVTSPCRKSRELRRDHRAIRRAQDEGDDSKGFGAGGYTPPPFPENRRGDRLCWSLFLEAMAALAVGAVRDGCAGDTTTRDRKSRKSLPDPNRLETPGTDWCDSGFLSPESTFPHGSMCSSEKGGFSEPRVPCRLNNGFDGGFEAYEERRRAEEEKVRSSRTREDMAGREGFTKGRATGELLLSEGGFPSRFGRSTYHDSRRNVELLPPLTEFDWSQEEIGSPSRQRPHPLQHEMCQRRGDGLEVDLLAAPRTPSALSPKVASVGIEMDDALAVGHLAIETSSSAPQAIEAPQARGEEAVSGWLDLPPATEKAERSPKAKHRPLEVVPPYPSLVKEVAADRARTGVHYCGDHHAAGTRREITAVARDESTPAELPANEGAPRQIASLPEAAGTEVVGGGTIRGEPDLGELSERHGHLLADHNLAAARTRIPAKAQPEAVQSPSSMKQGTSEGDGMLSAAPFHGGLPFASPSPAWLPVTNSEASVATLTEPPPAEKYRTADSGVQTHRPLSQCRPFGGAIHPGSSGSVDVFSAAAPAACTRASGHGGMFSVCPGDQSGFGKEGWGVGDAEGSRCRGERKAGVNVALSGDGGTQQVEGCDEMRQVEFPEPKETVVFAANIEATGCSDSLFEELLEPKVVAVYSRHRTELLALFRHYGVGTVRKAAACLGYSGIRRFVHDFPALKAWAQGEGTLRLIVRASCGRGCEYSGDEPPGRDSGLNYFAFLEVLTRMAHASAGPSPLHCKLLELISALKTEDPQGVFASPDPHGDSIENDEGNRRRIEKELRVRNPAVTSTALEMARGKADIKVCDRVGLP